MTHYEVAFKLQHECPYNAFSTKYPSVIISHWCNWSRDVLEIAHKDLEDQTIIKSIRDLIKQLGTRVIRRSQAMTNLQVVLQHCACDKLPPPTPKTCGGPPLPEKLLKGFEFHAQALWTTSGKEKTKYSKQ